MMIKRKPKPLYSNGQNVKCHWCSVQCTNTNDMGDRGATRDHVVPVSVGDSDMPRVWACRACNSVKADLTPLQWKVFRREFPDWREMYGQKGLAELRGKFVEIFNEQQQRVFAA